MSKSKRVVFTFDERSLNRLERIKDEGGYTSLAETVRGGLQIVDALRAQAKEGFTEVVVRSPLTGQERVLVIPALVASDPVEQSSP